MYIIESNVVARTIEGLYNRIYSNGAERARGVKARAFILSQAYTLKHVHNDGDDNNDGKQKTTNI